MTGAMLFSVLPNVVSAHGTPLSVDEGEKKEIFQRDRTAFRKQSGYYGFRWTGFT